MIIGSAAYFKVCTNCGDHGYIVFADMIRGPEVSSQEMALVLVDEARKLNRIQSFEVPELVRQIEISGLVRHEEDASLEAQLTTDATNIRIFFESELVHARVKQQILQ